MYYNNQGSSHIAILLHIINESILTDILQHIYVNISKINILSETFTIYPDVLNLLRVNINCVLHATEYL